MAVLTPQQRNTLESAIKQARKVAEQGAFNALHGMAVDHPEPFSHMNPEQRSLRNSLRSKARLLGDPLPANAAQKIDRISYELAYETWHKMLFAKFLEANGLLMHTDGVAVTMEDCEELAKEEGFVDKWDAAAGYASHMLPAIFRTGDPLMQVSFSTDDRIKLETIIDGLENQIFTADDALGWVYQFWQSEAKAAINASGDKIDGARLSAVTQLFTEPYMVHFLIDNTLGAWWVNRNPGVKPPVKFEYLRLLEDGNPAAGKFEGWPLVASQVTALDPCMGSGHFVASLFSVFAALRIHEEGLTKEEATEKVIAENLHGLELDPRCTQIAAFNLALTAWKFCGHYKELPEMNLACSGISPKGKEEDWVKLVGKVERFEDKERMENGMRRLFNHFQLAPELGSLLDPTIIKADAFTANFDQLQPVLKKALENERDKEVVERGVMAAGIAKAGEILSRKYDLVITNIPYLQRKKQAQILSTYAKKNYPDSQTDLATIFIDRSNLLLKDTGVLSIVSPANWIYQDYYKKFRQSILKSKSLLFIVQLGAGAFSQISGEVVKPILYIHSCSYISENIFSALDASSQLEIKDKVFALIHKPVNNLEQKKQNLNPDYRFSFNELSQITLLQDYVDYYNGITTGDILRFCFNFWELQFIDKTIYQFFRSTLNNTSYYGGCEGVLKWEMGHGELMNFVISRLGENNVSQWIRINEPPAKNGIIISAMGKLPASLFSKTFFDDNTVVIIPKRDEHLPAIWEFCSHDGYSILVRQIDQSLKVRGPLVKVPFDLDHWQTVAAKKYPNGLAMPFSNNPTQWLFHGHPKQTDYPLQVALSRIIGYRWPAENDAEMELAEEARELTATVKVFDHLSDDDGIFCIPSVNAEQAGADRLRDYLQQFFAGDWSNQTIPQLLKKEGSNATNLETWLRDEFFTQHCKVFQNRPFIWQIWDGRRDGFSALVNYHKLTKENLSKLIYTYLGDWIRMCEAKKRAEEGGADGLLIAARQLREKLEAILEGEAPYDIFVRWKPLHQQPIGWDPDLNDGVRLNIRPFMEADVLRKKPNIKWGIDRGKNPAGSPWGEIRDNDKHLTLEEKRKARETIKNQ